MPLQKLITTLSIILGGALLAVLGIGAWFYLQNRVPAASVTTEQPSVEEETPVSQNEIPIPSTPVSSPSTAPVDPQKEYDILFGKIDAKKLSFKEVSTTTGQYGDVFALYASDMAEAKKFSSTTFSIKVASVDLNGAGAAEAVVYEETPYACGSGGCNLDVHQKIDGKWELIFTALAYDTVGVSNVKNNGYVDFFLSIQGSNASHFTDVYQFLWNGQTYQRGNRIATWDGSTFNVGP